MLVAQFQLVILILETYFLLHFAYFIGVRMPTSVGSYYSIDKKIIIAGSIFITVITPVGYYFLAIR